MRASVIFTFAGFAPLLIAAAPIRLQPSSPWVVDYAENSCRLVRVFGQGKTETKLAFESEAPEQMDMLIIGKPLATSEDQVSARFLPAAAEPMVGNVARTVDNGNPAILWSMVRMLPDAVIKRFDNVLNQRNDAHVRPPAVSLAEQADYKAQRQEYATRAIELKVEPHRDRPLILETGSLGAPFAALDQCSRNSLKDWGIDPDLEDKIVRPVWAVNPARWLGEADYPRDMVWLGKESQVSVRLLIDANGKVTQCTSLSHYDEPEFNRITCANIVKRARFEPAELADGTKVPSYYTQRVVFRLPH